ncbi:MAG: PAS domain S-box protein [Gammaproteobacteria bacterium]|nr:PAS domain S-box protein [Gammaproteobacteria bacterium]
MRLKHPSHNGMSLRLFFTVPVLLLFIFTAGLVGLISYINGQQAALHYGQKLAEQISLRVNSHLQHLLAVPKTVLDSTLQSIDSGMLNLQSEQDLSRYMTVQIRNAPYLTYVSVGFANGRYLGVNRDAGNGQLTLMSSMQQRDLVRVRYTLQNLGLPGAALEQGTAYDVRTRSWFQHAVQQGKPSWYPIYKYRSYDGLGVGLAAPTYDSNGQLKAVVAADISLRHLQLYLQAQPLDGKGLIFITDQQGHLIASSSRAALLSEKGLVTSQLMASQSEDPLIQTAAMLLDRLQAPQKQQQFELDGQDYLLNLTKFNDPQGLILRIAVVLPQQQLMSFVDENSLQALWLILLAVIIGAVLIFVLSRKLVQPIEALHRRADLLASGDRTDFSLYQTPVFELNGLIHSFDLMATRLRDAFAQLEHKVEQGTASVDRLSLVVSRTSNGVVVTDPEGFIEWVNPAFERLSGYKASYLTGKALMQVMAHQKTDAMTLQQIQQAITAGKGFSEELLYYAASGQSCWLSLECDAVFSEQGQLTGFVVICLDISSRKKSETEEKDSQLRTQRQRSTLAQLVMDEAVASGDSLAFANSLVRFTADAVLCNRVSVWMLSEQGDEMFCLALHQSEGEPQPGQLLLRQADYPHYFAAVASRGWICANDAINDPATSEFAEFYLKPLGISSMLDAGIMIAGKVVGVLCLEHRGPRRQWHSDEEAFVSAIAAVMAQTLSVAQRKDAEQISKEYAQHTQTILNNVVDGIITIDENGRIASMNPAAQVLFRCKAEDLLGHYATNLLPPLYRQHQELQQAYLPTPGVKPLLGCNRELEGLRADGSTFSMEMALSVIRRQGRLIYICTVRDISDRKRIERLKNEFVSTVSHELRTPLTSITGALGLLHGGAMGDMPEKVSSLIGIAYKNCQRLTLLINDLLDIEKIAAGKMQFDLKAQLVLPLIQQALDANKVMAQERHIQLSIQTTVTDACIKVDAKRFIQVLSNFLSNAIKFSPTAATVVVELSLNEKLVRIAVADQGPGIPEKFRDRIFLRFSQADASDTRQTGGTGLGLAISKELVHGMNGLIGFDSVEGEGATFYCCFDLVQD